MIGDIELERRAERLLRSFSVQVAGYPMGHTQLLVALDFMVGPSQEMVIAGDPSLESTRAMINTIRRRFLPNKVLLLRPQGSEAKRLASLAPFVEAMGPVNKQPTVYVCEAYTCKAPVTDLDALKAIFD